jgi:hypothetical protein
MASRAHERQFRTDLRGGAGRKNCVAEALRGENQTVGRYAQGAAESFRRAASPTELPGNIQRLDSIHLAFMRYAGGWGLR